MYIYIHILHIYTFVFFVKGDKWLKNIAKHRPKSAIVLKKNLIANQYLMENILKLKQSLMATKSVQVFRIIEYLKKFSLHFFVSNTNRFCF